MANLKCIAPEHPGSVFQLFLREIRSGWCSVLLHEFKIVVTGGFFIAVLRHIRHSTDDSGIFKTGVLTKKGHLSLTPSNLRFLNGTQDHRVGNAVFNEDDERSSEESLHVLIFAAHIYAVAVAFPSAFLSVIDREVSIDIKENKL
ncbi:MAG: hypothetical protein K0M56_02175 [Kaistella sp.]|nr:hypothetical protein [Kaistella sp.]